MKINTTNEKVLALYSELEKLKEEDILVFFKMDIATNLRALKEQVEKLKIATDMKTIEGFTEYQKDLRDNFMKVANSNGVITRDNMPTYQKTEWEIEQKHPGIKERIKEFEKQRGELLDQDVEIAGLVQLKLSSFPDNTKVDILQLYDIIADDRGEKCTEQKVMGT